MQTDASTPRTGRLSREDQRRLGDILQRVYDDVVKQGVPDRFRHLLEELGSRPEGEQMRSKGSALHGQGGPEGESESDQVVEARGSINPNNKGPH
jgi:Anti-sigma factor NepR